MRAPLLASVLACASLLLLRSLAAHAQSSAPSASALAQAKQDYARATVQYNLGDFAGAVALYREAYELTAAPALLFNIAQAYRLEFERDRAPDERAQALYFYRTYLRLVPAAQNRADVQTLVGELEAETASSAPVTASAPATRPPASRSAVPRAQVPEARTGTLERDLGIGLGAAGVAMVVTGAFFGAAASSAASDLSNGSGPWSTADAAQYRAGQRDQTVEVALYATGTAALAAGTLFFVASRHDLAVHVASLPGGGDVVATWSF